MDNKLKFQQLECYKLATDEQKEKLNKEQYFGGNYEWLPRE